MRSWTGIPELKQAYKRVGPTKLFGLTAAIFAWCALGAWVQAEADWPDGYGFHCNRYCLIEDLWHSPAPIAHGGGYSIALFGYTWSFVIVPAALIVLLKLRKRRANDLSVPISTSDPE